MCVVRCIKLLLRCTDRQTLSLNSPYLFSVMLRDATATRFLVDSGFDVNADCELSAERCLHEHQTWCLALYSRRGSPLVAAARASALSNAHADHINALLEAGARPDALDSDHIPPLLAALASTDQVSMARLLVSAGASVNVYHPRVIHSFIHFFNISN